MSILYPVADTPEQALHSPRGLAAREREATLVAGGAVVFDRRLVGPAFRAHGAALDAYAGRIEDERPGRSFTPPVEARWCELKATSPEGVRPPVPTRPAMRDGRRWPAPETNGEVVWRLSIAFWRVLSLEALPEFPAARALRRDRDGASPLDAGALRRLSRQPLRPVKPQQPLDMGLFEVRLPEAPHLVVADE